MPARPAAGLTFGVGAATDAPTTAPGADTFTLVTEVVSVSGPGGERAEIDVTPLEETGAKRFIADIADAGSLEIGLNFDGANAQHQLLQGDFYTTPANTRNFQITLSDTTVVDIVGEVTQFSMDAQPGAAVTATVSIKVIGAPSFTYAT